MSKQPTFLKDYEESARKLIHEKQLGEIEFSGGTYQVQLLSPDEEGGYWVFLQFDSQDSLQDYFCSCEQYDEDQACSHLAAAYLTVGGEDRAPLHLQFQTSFWNALCRSLARKSHADRHLYGEKGEYEGVSGQGEKVFVLRATNEEMRKRLIGMIDERERQTEETSIKFSHLTAKELRQWKAGNPGFELSYELQVWSDVAKLLTVKQRQQESYTLSYEEDEVGVPLWVKGEFPGLEVAWKLDREDWEEVIPSTVTVDFSLKVRDEQRSFEEVVYSPQEKCLFLKGGEEKAPLNREEVHLPGDNWSFIRGKGFQKRSQGVSSGVVNEKEMGSFLDHHWEEVGDKIVGTAFQCEPVPLQYALKVEGESGLHIEAYLERPGDLSAGTCALFGQWLYGAEKGFLRVHSTRLGVLKKKVSQDQMGGFIAANRHWLNQQEGFTVHLATVEARLFYRVEEGGALEFFSALTMEEEEESVDFGEWVYIEGMGFFAKRAAGGGLSMSSGQKVPAEKVGDFIRTHRREVEQIPGFFSERSPIDSAGLHIGVSDSGKIVVEPESQVSWEYQEHGLRFYGDFVYVPDEGFSVIPLDQRIPEKFHKRCVIPPKEVTTFLSYELDEIREFATTVDPCLKRPNQLQLRVQKLEVHPKKRGYFVIEMGYRSEVGAVDILDLREDCRHQIRFAITQAGILDLQSPRFSWIHQLQKGKRELGEGLALSMMELLRIHAFEDLSHAYEGESEEMERWLQEITELSMPDSPPLVGLKSKLRLYQEAGLRWLWFLYYHKLSGLLCDDMGLGKTHQAMALLAAVRNQLPRVRGRGFVPPPFIVVCPTSVLYHWEEKLAEFLPKMQVYTYYGLRRSIEVLKEKRYDILLTSYGVLRADKERLSQFSFELAIYDEVQVAKNHSSRVHNALLELDARMRLGLSGTPIENRLRELKALFDVVLPGYMPGDKYYRDFFVNPIEREGDGSRKKLLSAFVQPFILRRKKSEVLDDLPEKTEEVGHCELFPEQRELYDQVLSRSRDRLMDQLQDPDNPVPYVHLFAILTHLKQVCDHPALYLKESWKEHACGKWNLFKELLNEALDSEQKVVVFSQYLGMLNIMGEYLQEIGVSYASVRGETRDRRKELSRFQEDQECRVFLGSLQAVGLGVDLTAASVVIHYDRWWNPARENQATDRVHRIGQKRGVQVFKLVTKGTVEETIDQMILKKNRLAEEIIGSDDEHLLKSFSREELMGLLQYVSDAPDPSLS